MKKSGGGIRVRADLDGTVLTLTVEDDGVGIEQERLDHLNDQLTAGAVDSTSGYGIYNVNSRLRLYYGDQYGLRLWLREGGGTRAVLTLPASPAGEDDHEQMLPG